MCVVVFYPHFLYSVCQPKLPSCKSDDQSSEGHSGLTQGQAI